MSEFIGSRISLISKSDIRYVGTLHNIDSENSSVALENVHCCGTEGRLGNPDEEIAPSKNVYEYIVFRGSDVKDLRIEEPPKESRPPPSELNDPAILGTGSRPQTHNDPPYQHNHPHSGNQPPQQYPFAPPGPQQPSHFQTASDHPYLPYNQYPNQQKFGGYPHGPHHPFPGGPPNEFPSYPGGPYGPPPNWRPSPGPPNQPGAIPMMHQDSPVTKNATEFHQAQGQPPPGLPAELGQKPAVSDSAGQPTPSSDPTGGANAMDVKPPPPPLSTKPDMSAETVIGPTVQSSQQGQNAAQHPMKGRIVPAVPLIAPKNKTTQKPAGSGEGGGVNGKIDSHGANHGQAASDAARQYQSAAQAASAAVAAAMAKLPPAPGMKSKPNVIDNDSVDNLTKRVNEMRTNENNRISRGRGSGGYTSGGRGRGGRRGAREQGRGLEVPKTDFDFESANAKFNKQELANEAITAGSGAEATGEGESGSTRGESSDVNGTSDVIIPAAVPSTYNKASFFDNISSEARDRDETGDGKIRQGGAEFRDEERKRNMETFGQGSVDSNFRGRGRGRSRGYGGGYGRYSRGPRGNRGGMNQSPATAT